MQEDKEPKAIESEEIVIGNLINTGSLFILYESRLTPKCFYLNEHKEIYASMKRLFKAGSAIDMITIMEDLKKANLFESIGGINIMLKLSNPTTSLGIESHVSIIVDRFKTREIIRLSHQALSESYKGNKLNAEIIANLERGLNESVDTTPVISLADTQRQFLDEVQGKTESGVSITGIKSIDKIATVRKGNLVVIGARPSMGKSMFATTIQNNLANQNMAGLFQNLEMTTVEGWKRTAACRYSIEFSKLTDGEIVLGEYNASQFDELFSMMDNLFFFDDKTGINALSLKSKLMSIMVKTPLQYLIIDHGKLMKHNMLAGNKRSDEEIGATCNALKEIAKDLNIFVILLWQLKRPTGDVVRIPSLSDLRGSGEIEESADIVMFLHRDEYYGIEGAVNGKTDVVIAKNRNGDTGVVECTFVPNYSRFEDLHDENDWMGVSKDVVENKIEKNTSNILF
tara:strand:- start:5248 stop:6615 length:1368 start_codon:yes stop_codon:yes gene_type:complete